MTSLQADPPARPAGARAGRWMLLAAVALLGVATLGRCGGGGATPSSSPLLLAPADLAGGDAGSAPRWQAVSLPVSLAQAEAAARAASLGALPSPASRAAATYRDSSSGEEVTHVVLAYADEAGALALQEAAAPLLGRTFGLIRAPIALAGVEDAASWTSSQYAAVSFRSGPFVALVGSTRAGDEARLMDLAARARDRLLIARTPTATGEAGATASP